MSDNLSRKDFFRLSFKKASATVFDLLDAGQEAAGVIREAIKPKPPGPKLPEVIRPPGALPEKQFQQACTKCDDCVKACPHWVIRKAAPEFGEAVANSPILIPNDNPCLFCADLPCIDACDTGALKRPEEGIPLRIGLAVVNPETCYLNRGQPCDYCQVHCPTEPKSILAGERGTLPTVDEDLCTGCGSCAQICPANAITIRDRRTGEEVAA